MSNKVKFFRPEIKIKVKVEETYPGSCWYRVKIYPSGYGGDKHPGFVLVQADNKYLAESSERNGHLFRPEYAKALKMRLELDLSDIKSLEILKANLEKDKKLLDQIIELVGNKEQEAKWICLKP